MTKFFQYSVLKYRVSYLLDERVNIGLLFHFSEDKKIVFVSPSKLKRISQFFPHFVNLSDIRRYLNGFERKANSLTKDGFEKPERFDDFIQNEFLAKDANSFFFSNIKFGFYESVEQILDYYTDKYFKYFDGDGGKEKHNDAFVRNHFESLLKTATKSKGLSAHCFKRDVVIGNKIGKTEFEFGWQNGTTNLVKTLGFDLADDTYIQEKAFRWFGAITHLKEILPKGIRFDFVVAPPSKHSLFEAYENALKVLDNIKADKLIVEENGLTDYVEDALDTIKPFELVF